MYKRQLEDILHLSWGACKRCAATVRSGGWPLSVINVRCAQRSSHQATIPVGPRPNSTAALSSHQASTSAIQENYRCAYQHRSHAAIGVRRKNSAASTIHENNRLEVDDSHGCGKKKQGRIPAETMPGPIPTLGARNASSEPPAPGAYDARAQDRRTR